MPWDGGGDIGGGGGGTWKGRVPSLWGYMIAGYVYRRRGGVRTATVDVVVVEKSRLGGRLTDGRHRRARDDKVGYQNYQRTGRLRFSTGRAVKSQTASDQVNTARNGHLVESRQGCVVSEV